MLGTLANLQARRGSDVACKILFAHHHLYLVFA